MIFGNNILQKKDWLIFGLTAIFILTVPLIAFYSTQVPFFDQPHPFFIGLLGLAFLLSFNVHESIRLLRSDIVYGLVAYALFFTTIVFMHFITDSGVALYLLPVYLSFVVYFIIFTVLFRNRTNHLDLIIYLFIYLLIFTQAVFSVGEFYLVTSNSITYSELWNNANNHYSVEHQSVGYRDLIPFISEYRPLGLFGQYTMNGVIPIIAFMGLIFIDRKCFDRSLIESLRYHRLIGVLMIISVIYSGSGTALFLAVVTVLALIFFYGPQHMKWWVPLLTVYIIVSLLYLGNSFSITRISGDYLLQNVYHIKKMILDYSQQDIVSLFIGYDHLSNIASIDSNLPFLLGMTGILGLFIFILVYLFLILKTKNIELRIFLTVVVIGSLHYPVMGNQVVHVLVGLMLARYFLSIQSNRSENVNSIAG